MGRRRAAQHSDRGGGDVPATRTSRPRLALAALSALAYAAIFAYAIVLEPSLGPLLATVGGLGGVLHACLLWRRWEELLPWSLGLLGADYAVAAIVHGQRVDGAAPLVAVGLLLAGELAVWSLDERWDIVAERQVVAARARALAALCAAALAAAALVIALAAAPVGGGLVWTALGAASVVLVVAIAARLARR